MARLLFVDDEGRILSGIRRVLRARCSTWTVELADDPARAIELLGGEPYDVVVSDIRMPGMSGNEFLEVVKERMPSATRVVLSGHCDDELTTHAVTVAHQFLSKPCSAQTLIDTLTRAVESARLLDSEELRRVVGGVSRLPSPPRVYQRLTAAMADPEVALEALEAILRQDIALCAKLLQLVNSSFFGLGQVISDVRHAASYLGVVTLRRVVLSAEVFSKFDPDRLPSDFDLVEQQIHALQVAEIASAILAPRELKETAFTAGMLHDLGDLVLATALPAEFERNRAARRARREGAEARRRADEAERLHARVGAYLIGQWGLPGEVVQAVARHHDPRPCGARPMELRDALAIADKLTHAANARDGVEARSILREMESELLEPLGATARLEEWTDLALRIASRAA
jgi:HD-like signal output (HDOD) protein/ActR/RegA family two-component response regulator